MLLDNIKQIRYRLRLAAERAGRSPDSVSLIAVTKYAPLRSIKEVLDSGLVDEVAENKVLEAQAKQEALGPSAKKARWRLTGHLQTNKANKALQVFDAIDTVDSSKLAGMLDRSLAAQCRSLPVLVQVKLSGEAAQSGVAPEALEKLLEDLKACRNLDVRGLMALAPELSPVEAVRPHFKRMRGLFDKFFGNRPDAQLSMGMSRDFEIAVEEGATHVRIGSKIFSENQPGRTS